MQINFHVGILFKYLTIIFGGGRGMAKWSHLIIGGREGVCKGSKYDRRIFEQPLMWCAILDWFLNLSPEWMNDKHTDKPTDWYLMLKLDIINHKYYKGLFNYPAIIFRPLTDPLPPLDDHLAIIRPPPKMIARYLNKILTWKLIRDILLLMIN